MTGSIDPAPARILVTGATGFVGQAVLRQLAGQGHDVIATHRGQPAPDAPQDVIWAEADLEDPYAITALCETHQPTHLLALAWYIGPGWQTSERNFLWLSRSLDLLAAFAASGGRRVVFCGSCMEYDWSVEKPFVEGVTPLNPRTEYGVAKASLYRAFGPYMAKLGLSAAWGRPYFLYGPGEARHRLAADVIISLLEGREALCSHGRQKRDFLHVDDVASAMLRLLLSDYEGPLNVGSGTAIPLTDLIGEVARQIGRPDLVRLGARDAPPDDPDLVEADVTQLRDTLGWKPRYDLETGIAETIAWWKKELQI